ncbi:MAG: phage tail tape measure protein, partial [Alphaproteobacteria bacterium]
MAFERIGLGGVLKFNETQALAGMKRASAGFAKLRLGARNVGSGLASIGGGARNAALALAPVAIGLALGAKKAADFEKQMSAVGAITRASEEDFGRLTAEAKRLGVVSVFSASESAQAMEFLGRAGFDTTQIISGLGGVMNAAAAEGVDLATSADIVARVVKSMGEEIDDAAHIADVLVLTSAKTNTNLIALGESFKFGAAQAKVMGISTEETAAIFGKMADAGLRGSIGGTSFTNMLIKLAKPTSKGQKLMDKWGVSLTDASGALRPMSEIVEQFKGQIDQIPSATEKARVMTELFGIRGSKAYSALSLAGGKALRDLTADLKASSFGVGAAAEAAERRLDNFLGSMKLFGSSLEALSIELFGPMLGAFKETVQDMTGGLNSVLFSMQGLTEANQTFNMAAGRMSKERASALANELGLVDRLGERQAANAQAGLAAVTRSMIGEEKLTRAQRAARAQGFATFIEQGLKREGISDAGRKAQRKHLKQILETAKAQGLSQKQELALRRRFLESLAAQQAGTKKLGLLEKAQATNKLERTLAQAAAEAKIQAQARGLLEREKKLGEIEEKHGRTARFIAEGVLEAIETIKTGFKSVVKQVTDFGDRMRESIGEDNLKRFAKIATIAV